MASFVIHYIAGEQFLKDLEKKYGVVVSPRQRQQFLLGNLIVDSSRVNKKIPEGITEEEVKKIKKKIQDEVQKEKISTHFRDEAELNLCIQTPKLERFMEKYQDIVLKNFTALGYLYHLYTDKRFFDDLFTETFECLNKQGEPSIYLDQVVAMKVKKNGSIYPVREFWSYDTPVSIYHDYTVMNKLLLEENDIVFDQEGLLKDVEENFWNPGIVEVNYQSAEQVVAKTASFIASSYRQENDELNVFSKGTVQEFIPQVSSQFFDEYSPVLSSIFGTTLEHKNKIYSKEMRKC